MKILGLILAVAGVLTLLWGGTPSRTGGTDLASGPLSVSASAQRFDDLPAIIGLSILLGGVTLIRIGARRTRLRKERPARGSTGPAASSPPSA